MKRGVLYLSLGVAYHQYTTASITALRATGYSGAVRVVTDDAAFHRLCVPGLGVEVVQVPSVESELASRHYKTSLINYGYSECLFLDSDTLPVGNPDAVWDFLKAGDFHLCLDQHPVVSEALDRLSVVPDECDLMTQLGLIGAPHLNSGVMLFKQTPAVSRLFRFWYREWTRFRHRDQLPLVRAIAATKTLVGVLPATWNSPPDGYSSASSAKSAGINVLHFYLEHRRRWAEFVR
jgi:hypothetical protein